MKLFASTSCIAMLLSLAAWSTTAAAAAPEGSIDDQLLEDLESDLLDGLDEVSPQPTSAGLEAPESLDRELLEQLGDGEDIELGDSQDPLTQIGRRMQLVGQRMGGDDTSAQTQQLQQQIVRDLQELLKQCQQCQSKAKASSAASQPRKSGQPQEAQAGEQRPSNKPARDSTTRLDQAEAARPTAQQRQDLIRRAWGHLPAKVREQMQNAGVEQFLPKYEELIEQYYKRLAEERRSYP